MPRKRKAGKSKPRKGRKSGAKGKKSGFTSTSDRAKGGTEDREDNVLIWEYTGTTGISAGGETIFAIKGNGLYRPGGITTYGLAQTTSPAGYARMYTQYTLAHVRSSKLELTAWGISGTVAGGVPTGGVVSVPLRLACVPIQSAQAATYVGLNVATLGGLAHATSAFRNNTVRVRNRGNDGLLLTGVGRDSSAETVTGDYSAASTGDPAAPWYYIIGIANASTSLNASTLEFRIRVTYNVRWYQPVAQAVQFALRDRFGNEESGEAKGSDAKSAPQMRAAADSMSLQFSGDVGPESDDPDEILFRKMLSARLGTVVPRKATILSSVAGAPGAGGGHQTVFLRAVEPPETKKS